VVHQQGTGWMAEHSVHLPVVPRQQQGAPRLGGDCATHVHDAL
jgi:hypothetical protein